MTLCFAWLSGCTDALNRGAAIADRSTLFSYLRLRKRYFRSSVFRKQVVEGLGDKLVQRVVDVHGEDFQLVTHFLGE